MLVLVCVKLYLIQYLWKENLLLKSVLGMIDHYRHRHKTKDPPFIENTVIYECICANSTNLELSEFCTTQGHYTGSFPGPVFVSSLCPYFTFLICFSSLKIVTFSGDHPSFHRQYKTIKLRCYCYPLSHL